MENDSEISSDKKLVNEVNSFNNGLSTGPRIKAEGVKRKLYVNDAVRSLDLALGRLKKTKLVNANNRSCSGSSMLKQTSRDMFMDTHPSLSLNPIIDNASTMSMNFSHYELLRNLSEANCNSDGAVSGTTEDRHRSPSDRTFKDEHLEKYFRSIEAWSRNYKIDAPSSVHLKLS